MGKDKIKEGEKIEDFEVNYNKGYSGKNKHYNLVVDTNNRQKFIQYDKETGLQDRIMSFKQATALFRGFYANKVIARIQTINQIGRKDALEIYHKNKDAVKERRLANIQIQEPTVKDRTGALVFYNTMIRKGNYRGLQKYGS